MNRLILIFFALSALIGLGCEKEEEPASAALPTNLSTVVSINDGVVEIQASAENVNFYTVTYSEAANTTVVESTDGFASYMYTESGTYTVITRAHQSKLQRGGWILGNFREKRRFKLLLYTHENARSQIMAVREN